MLTDGLNELHSNTSLSILLKCWWDNFKVRLAFPKSPAQVKNSKIYPATTPNPNFQTDPRSPNKFPIIGNQSTSLDVEVWSLRKIEREKKTEISKLNRKSRVFRKTEKLSVATPPVSHEIEVADRQTDSERKNISLYHHGDAPLERDELCLNHDDQW